MIVLPQPPNDKQKYLYTESNRFLFYVFAISSSLLLFSGMYLFTWANPALIVYGLFVTVNVLYLIISYVIGVFGKGFDLDAHNSIITKYNKRDSSVDIFLPIAGESIEVIANTWKYVAQLDWPKELLKVHILDDGFSDAARDLAITFGFNYIRRDDRPHLKKAGNVRNAFKQTSGDFIVILDADFCPRPDFLHETVPYMLSDEKIAIVQTPQFFEVKPEQTWVEQGAGFIQELFYRLIQVSRDTWGASICVGSCALYRRSALEPMGGTYPIEHSEDLHTGLSMLIQGLRVKYIPISVAAGVCPDSHQSFFVQMYRWCTGSTSLLFNKMFWTAKLTFMQRLCYLSGMGYYVSTALGIWLSVLPSVIMVWFLPEKLLWYTMFFYTPSFLFGTLFMRYWNKSRGNIIHALMTRQISYYSHFFALKDKLFKSTMPWIPTGAVTNNSRFRTARYLMWAWSSVVTVLVVSGAFYHMDGLLDYDFYPTLFFCGLNYWITSTILRDQ